MVRRTGVIALIVVFLVGLVVADRELSTEESSAEISSIAPASQLDPDEALDSTWYCVGGTAADGGQADISVVVINIGDQSREGTITWIPNEGGAISDSLKVNAYSTVTTPVPPEITAPYVSAILDLDGGEVAVEHVVTGTRGTHVAPCASEPSPTWYLANGSTARDASQFLMILNPFASDAVVDVTFATDEGRDAPASLQGLPIAPRSMKAIDLGERRRDLTSTALRSRKGQVVVERLQSFDASTDRVGLSLSPGAPGTSNTWYFPRGHYDAATSERWHIFNPSNREAEVTIEIASDDSTLLPEPIDLVVSPGSRVTVDSAEQARVPAGATYSVQIRSLNGVAVVAEREVNGKAPTPPRGWSSALGAPRSSVLWVFPIGESSDSVHEGMVVLNPGSSAIRFSVFTLADGKRSELSALQAQEIKPGARVNIGFLEIIRLNSLPLIIEASGPVVVERQMSSMGTGGSSWGTGIPGPSQN